MNKIQTGLENLLANPPARLENKRIGLLCNPASVDGCLRHAGILAKERFGKQLTALFSPQHGLYAEKQDNMIESDDFTDPMLGIPVFSLYGKTRRPTREMIEAIDVLIVDLQDAGTRVYTFFTTLSYCLEEAASHGKPVFILDRPNPAGGDKVEGNCLQPAFTSFVGRYPIPMRHGLSIGEYALWINDRYGIGCELEVIAMNGWRRSMRFRETGLFWVPPSPNLPTPESALVYPGQVIWEGTNVSEGRGTTQPFELFGAPYFDIDGILNVMGGSRQEGCFLRPAVFEPVAHKWQGRACRGFQIHVTDGRIVTPWELSMKLLAAILKHHGPEAGGEFGWKQPPYEYEFERLPIDLILGDDTIRKQLEGGGSIGWMISRWREESRNFEESTRPYRLYE